VSSVAGVEEGEEMAVDVIEEADIAGKAKEEEEEYQ
jgi:hypothetical protein